MDIKIEKDVPIPTGGRTNPYAIYPWQGMVIGESFRVPANGVGLEIFRRRVYQAARMRGFKYNEKYVVRIEDEGVRVWRTA